MPSYVSIFERELEGGGGMEGIWAYIHFESFRPFVIAREVKYNLQNFEREVGKGWDDTSSFIFELATPTCR